MIYRFVVCHLLGLVSLMLALATALTHQMSHFGPRRSATNSFWPFLIANTLRGKVLGAVLGGLLASAAWFLLPGIGEYVGTGHVSLHWSRLLAGSFSIFAFVITGVFAMLTRIVRNWQAEPPVHTLPEIQRPWQRANSPQRELQTTGS